MMFANDITFCINEKCKKKDTCRRHYIPLSDYISVSDFGGKKDCEHYIVCEKRELKKLKMVGKKK